jgi:hypothetical protein
MLRELADARTRQRGYLEHSARTGERWLRLFARRLSVTDEVDLVEHDCDRRTRRQRLGRPGERGFEPLTDIGDPKYMVGDVDLPARAPYTFALDGIEGRPQSRRIDNLERNAAERQALADRVARGAGHIRDDRRVEAREPVQQARFTGIRRTRDRDSQTVVEHGALSRAFLERRDLGFESVGATTKLRLRAAVDVLVRKIEPSLAAHTKLRELLLHALDAGRKLARKRPERRLHPEA